MFPSTVRFPKYRYRLLLLLIVILIDLTLSILSVTIEHHYSFNFNQWLSELNRFKHSTVDSLLFTIIRVLYIIII
jgi:hypothetical protein